QLDRLVRLPRVADGRVELRVTVAELDLGRQVGPIGRRLGVGDVLDAVAAEAGRRRRVGRLAGPVVEQQRGAVGPGVAELVVERQGTRRGRFNISDRVDWSQTSGARRVE